MSLSSGRGASPPRQLSERPAAGRPPTLSFASRLRAAFGRREPDAAREAVLAERLEILLDIAKGLSRTLDRRGGFLGPLGPGQPGPGAQAGGEPVRPGGT